MKHQIEMRVKVKGVVILRACKNDENTVLCKYNIFQLFVYFFKALGHVLKEKFCAVMDLVCQHMMNMDVTIIVLLNVLKMNNFVLDKLDMTIMKDMNMIEIFMIMEIVLNQIFAFIKIVRIFFFKNRREKIQNMYVI